MALVRSVVGDEVKEMDIIRALHMSNNDAAAAINIILDTPRPLSSSLPPPSNKSFCPNSSSNSPPNPAEATAPPLKSNKKQKLNNSSSSSSRILASSEPCSSSPSPPLPSSESDWWLIGSTELAGLSTCKGRRINPGDKITFSFPKSQTSNSPSALKFPAGRTRPVASCSEIVRFSHGQTGEIGRIPNEWARCLSPLVNANKVRVDGFCKSAPSVLSIMDTVHLSVSIYINSLMFSKHHQTSLKPTSSTTEASTVHPLLILFRLLGLEPFKRADFTPEDLYTRKQSTDTKESSVVPGVVLPAERCGKSSLYESKDEGGDDKIPEYEMENIVGLADGSQLEEMTPPSTLQCELRPYQKQALHWMVQVEKGKSLEKAATTLHPCWDAYRLADKREPVVYLNVFSGDATAEFPSALQIPRGGMLWDLARP